MSTCLITEVKQLWAKLVLGWVTIGQVWDASDGVFTRLL